MSVQQGLEVNSVLSMVSFLKIYKGQGSRAAAGGRQGNYLPGNGKHQGLPSLLRLE